jgi:tRNA-uridine 2-sulfurtransferase
MITKNKTVVVALSGGIDSSVSAVLLKEKGFFVSGIFLRLLEESFLEEEKARKVAKELDIPFYVLDVQKEFKKKVIDSFLSSLERGITPNPCVVCNREIKFQVLLKRLSEYNADYLATGHYVKLREGKLFVAKDKGKDQSYFLWKIKKEWFDKLIFPLGDYKKDETRKIAKKLNLSTVKEKESQEICFIKDDISSFLKRNFPDSPGKVINTFGEVIGKHTGLFNYTVGQRKGLGFSGGPYYVLGKDTKKNNLIITKDEEELSGKELFYEKENFFQDISFPFKAKVKIRYRSNPVNAVVEKGKVTFSRKQRAITPGQSVVFYKNEELLGGGIIKENNLW